MTITTLLPGEVHSVLPLAQEFAAEIADPIITLSPEPFVTNWSRFLEVDVGFIVAAWDDDRPVGAISAYAVPDDRTGEIVVQETWYFVSATHRGCGVGAQLLNRFEAEAARRGAKRISMGRLHHVGDGVGDMLERRGYRPFETLYYKMLGA